MILLINIIGMIPYSITITAQFIFVFSISIVIFISLNILGFKIHKFNLFFLFLPGGVPLALVPAITLLEFLLYFIRAVSLSLRLSANMVAGHILMKILIYAFINIPLLSVIILPIFFLEIMVAFLQAYIYLTLTLSYYQDISIPH
jgi:ATP synthase subunit 6